MYPAIPSQDNNSNTDIADAQFSYTPPTYNIVTSNRAIEDKLKYANDLLIDRVISSLESAWLTPLELVAMTKVITTVASSRDEENTKTLLDKLETKYKDT